MIEAQVAYVLDALAAMDRHDLAAVEVHPDVQAAYNTRVQEQMRGTVWTAGGCASWYLDPTGRNTALWPGATWSFRARTRRLDTADYRLRPRTPGRRTNDVPVASRG